MKILFLVHFDGAGRQGPFAHARGIIKAFHKLGAELTVLSPGWTGHVPANVRTLDVRQWRRTGFQKVTFTFAALPLFVVELWRNRPACVYARYFHLLFVFAFIARLFRVPLYAEHNADIHAEHKIHRRSVSVRLLHDFAERALLASHSGSIVVTQSILASWQRAYRRPPRVATVIRNGVDAAVYTPLDQRACQRDLGLSDSKLYVCYVGSFAPHQGLRVLLEAFGIVRRTYPQATLLLAGGRAEEVARLQTETSRIGLAACVHLVSEIPEQVAARYIGASDVCVAPYDRTAALRTGLVGPGAPMNRDPLKIYSYMACAKPVVASHFREAGHHLQQVRAGLAVPPEDANALGRAILTLLSDDRLRTTMGVNGRRYVLESATWETVARATLAFITSATDTRHKAVHRC